MPSLALVTSDPGLTTSVVAMIRNAGAGWDFIGVSPAESLAALRHAGADIVLIDADGCPHPAAALTAALLAQAQPVAVIGCRLGRSGEGDAALLARGAVRIIKKPSGPAGVMLAGETGRDIFGDIVRIFEASIDED